MLLRLTAILATFAVITTACSETNVGVAAGTVNAVNVSGEGIGLEGGEGYLIGTGLNWRDIDGSWHEGGIPECVPPLSSGATVELGVVDVPADHDGIGQPNHVVWLKCLSMPTDVSISEDSGLGPYHHFCERMPDHEVCG